MVNMRYKKHFGLTQIYDYKHVTCDESKKNEQNSNIELQMNTI